MARYRLRYTKGESIKFISHLDIVRILSRAARRAGIQLAYSHGFNPHPEMVFGAPLPLGVTSEAEYVDMTIDSEIDEIELAESLSKAMPDGISVIEAVKLGESAATIMKYVYACVYSVTLKVSGTHSPESFAEAGRSILQSQKPLEIMKKSKSATKITDVRPMIFDFFEKASFDGCFMTFECVTAAGNDVNLRPELAVQAIAESCGAEIEVVAIHKLKYLEKKE